MKFKNLLFITVGIIAITLLAIGLFTTGITTKVFAGDLVSITDNVKVYDEETKTATITDKDDNVLVTAKLLTPLINEVGLGYQRVAEIEFETFDDYTTFEDMMSKIELYNVKDNLNSMTKQIDYKYKTTESYSVNDYSCSNETVKNGTIINNCVVTGSHLEYKDTWLDLNEKVAYTKGNLVVGLYTTTTEGENVEWIPTIENVKVEEWASWTASLNTGLVVYYKFDDNSANTSVLDSIGGNDGVATTNTNNLYYAGGKINSALDLNGVDEGIDFSKSIPSGARTVSFWFNFDSYVSSEDQLFWGNVAGDWNMEFINHNVFFYSGGSGVASGGDISTGNWYHYILTQDSSGNIQGFLNGVSIFNDTGATTTALTDFDMGKRGSQRWVDGRIDETGIWNRSLSVSEVNQLYNSGDGITYIGDFSVNCQFSGYVFDENDNAFKNINISIVNQDDFQEYYTDLTDANGFWTINITNSTNEYEVTARINDSTSTKTKSYISGQC